MKKIFTLCVVLCLSYLTMGASTPKHEFRATWLATVSGIDWPKTKATNDATREQQKQELIDIFDKMKAGNLNAVCFQVRSLCDAMYQSSYEPWSIALTGTRGKGPGYDPLQFAIDEAHKRGMKVMFDLVAGHTSIDHPWFMIFGLPWMGFASSDYFPLLPNFGFFLLGSALGKTLYRKKESLLPKVNEKNILIRFFAGCGRQSLWLYLLHQPVLSGIFYLILMLK